MMKRCVELLLDNSVLGYRFFPRTAPMRKPECHMKFQFALPTPGCNRVQPKVDHITRQAMDT